MLSDTRLIELLGQLGYSDDIAKTYAFLYSHGPSTISHLSAGIGVERTKLYRLSGSLLASGLVRTTHHSGRNCLAAAPLSVVATKLRQRIARLQQLGDLLP